ncbi:hypothetical protein ZIOFF_042168 [Zingiber officinale]|uniref:Uncharacterized protein n=1 Tax=Zingiber officinale TaxID=94328 RepID=A0A8J5GEY1_ZINOF|nr:hypothetical protein ZIOFF_042168 [Zingiber officinale]
MGLGPFYPSIDPFAPIKDLDIVVRDLGLTCPQIVSGTGPAPVSESDGVSCARNAELSKPNINQTEVGNDSSSRGRHVGDYLSTFMATKPNTKKAPKKKEVKKETGLGLTHRKDENFGEWYSEVCIMRHKRYLLFSMLSSSRR